MSSDDSENGSGEYVLKEQFMSEIAEINVKRSRKPMWTRQRVQDVIKLIEEFKAATKRARNSTEHYYINNYEVIEEGKDKILTVMRKLSKDPIIRIIPSEDYYEILNEIHTLTKHGGRDKMLNALKNKHQIPISVVNTFIKLCKVCNKRKVSRVKTCEKFSRGLIELIDLQSMSDGEFKWILHYQDYATKYSILRPLTTIRATTIAFELLKVFLEIGAPVIVHGDDKFVLTNDIIAELIIMWPDCKILTGKPIRNADSHEPSEAFLVENMLKTWIRNNKSQKWSLGIHFVQFEKNSTVHKSIEKSPFRTLFGTESMLGLRSINITGVLLDQIHREEDLESIQKQSIVPPLRCGTSSKNSQPETVGAVYLKAVGRNMVEVPSGSNQESSATVTCKQEPIEVDAEDVDYPDGATSEDFNEDQEPPLSIYEEISIKEENDDSNYETKGQNETEVYECVENEQRNEERFFGIVPLSSKDGLDRSQDKNKQVILESTKEKLKDTIDDSTDSIDVPNMLVLAKYQEEILKILERQNSGNPFDNFTRYVASLLGTLPMRTAYALQSKIIDMIISEHVKINSDDQ